MTELPGSDNVTKRDPRGNRHAVAYRHSIGLTVLIDDDQAVADVDIGSDGVARAAKQPDTNAVARHA